MQGTGNMKYIEELCNCLRDLNTYEIDTVCEWIRVTVQNGGAIFIVGNGGSSATAAHWACDLKKTLGSINGKPVNVSCLCDNVPLLTAYANDCSFEDIFAMQLRGRFFNNDLLIVLSASGNSENLIRAIQYSNHVGAKSISIVGDLNGRAIESSTLSIVVDSKNYGIIEDIHLSVNHIITQQLSSH